MITDLQFFIFGNYCYSKLVIIVVSLLNILDGL